MKEAIRDCPAISYFDRYPVIRSFVTRATVLGERRKRRGWRGGCGPKEEKK